MNKKKNRRILIADDDETIRESLTEILKSDGYSVEAVENGRLAIQAVQREEPDVILLDIFMPKMTGLEATQILKNDKKYSHIPIVIVTGQKDLESRIKALKTGADDFLTKPPHHAELTARVRSLIKVKAYHDHMENNKILLEEQVRQRTQQLRKMYNIQKKISLETIFYLSRAAEYRDEDTSMHIHRVSQYAALLAENIGLDRNTIETIMYASPMHDIGKIGTPDRILLKPGKLTETEWKIMKDHTVIGARILEGSKSKYIHMGKTIALTHHEKWNGKGYPRGLKKEKIPIEGRITAVADVFDALTSKRPYKEALPADEAFTILSEQRGLHFDPELVDSFLSSKKEVLKINEILTENEATWEFISTSFDLPKPLT
jgi:putative two-component system response regulator